MDEKVQIFRPTWAELKAKSFEEYVEYMETKRAHVAGVAVVSRIKTTSKLCKPSIRSEKSVTLYTHSSLFRLFYQRNTSHGKKSIPRFTIWILK